MRLALLALLLLCPGLVAAAEVLASNRPLALIAQAVMQSGGSPIQLVPDGQSTHDYALRPSDRVALARARIVLWLGPEQEPFLAKALAASPARVVAVQALPGLLRLPQRRLENGGPVAGSLDAHLWLEPRNAAVIARALAETLAQLEPGNAAYYRQQAEAFAQRLTVLQGRLKGQFATLPTRDYLAYHDAYQYLEQPLGLRFRGAVTYSHEQKPGARHMAQLAGVIRAQKVACLLAEPGFDPALVQRIFTGQPARFVSVDEFFVQAPRNSQGYEAGLSQMAAGIHRCLAGS